MRAVARRPDLRDRLRVVADEEDAAVLRVGDGDLAVAKEERVVGLVEQPGRRARDLRTSVAPQQRARRIRDAHDRVVVLFVRQDRATVVDEERVVGKVEATRRRRTTRRRIHPRDVLVRVDDDEPVDAAVGDEQLPGERSLRRGRDVAAGAAVSDTTTTPATAAGASPPMRYARLPTVATAASATGAGSDPAGANVACAGSKRRMSDDSPLGVRPPATKIVPPIENAAACVRGCGRWPTTRALAGAHVDRLHRVRRRVRPLAAEHVDHVAERADRGIAHADRQPRHDAEVTPSVVARTSRVRSGPVVAADEVHGGSDLHRGEIGTRLRKVSDDRRRPGRRHRLHRVDARLARRRRTRTVDR